MVLCRLKFYKVVQWLVGAITEISSKQAKIIIDFGSELDEVIRLPEIEGLTKGKPIYDAVFITHYHRRPLFKV